jgi:hypothetical protein
VPNFVGYGTSRQAETFSRQIGQAQRCHLFVKVPLPPELTGQVRRQSCEIKFIFKISSNTGDTPI